MLRELGGVAVGDIGAGGVEHLLLGHARDEHELRFGSHVVQTAMAHRGFDRQRDRERPRTRLFMPRVGQRKPVDVELVGQQAVVTSSGPTASVSLTDPTRGIYRVFWHRSIQLNCIAMANPTNVPAVLGQASADTLGPFGRGRNTYFIVQTFDAGGNNVPESVNVVVICP
jgi:hypothetical protein